MAYQMFTKKKDAKDKKNIQESIKLIIQNLKQNEKDYEKYEIVRFGRFLEAEAYYHEVDEYYRCIGFEVEIESQFSFGEGENKKLMDVSNDIGFYSTWIGKSHRAAPFTFEESGHKLGNAHRFSNGFGDHVVVLEELMSVEEVQKVAQELLEKI